MAGSKDEWLSSASSAAVKKSKEENAVTNLWGSEDISKYTSCSFITEDASVNNIQVGIYTKFWYPKNLLNYDFNVEILNENNRTHRRNELGIFP